jgi:hypothetical protein
VATDLSDVPSIDAAIAASSGAPGFGVTPAGFVPKPYGRLIAEKIALAQALIGPDVDVTPGSPLRVLLEIAALEDARGWAALAASYDDLFVVSATGTALSRLGDELGLARPFLEAHGTITLTLSGPLPAGVTQLEIPRGSRLSTPGGHHVALAENVVLSAASTARDVAVVAFYPGPSHNLDPALDSGGVHSEQIDRWNGNDAKLAGFVAQGGPALVTIKHTAPLSGGELQWDDVRYRRLLLQAPRSLWTVDAVRLAAALVPGVRQVVVRDGVGGLDIEQSIFGDFSFVERLFSSDRDLGSPYYFTVLVALTRPGLWDGPDGVAAQVASAIDDLRPIGIFPRIVQAAEIGVGVRATLVVRGLPIPGGTGATVNASAAAKDLKARLYERFRAYVEGLAFGEPVRAAEVTWSLMNEPGIVDVRDLHLLRYPPQVETVDFLTGAPSLAQALPIGENVVLGQDQIAVPVQADDLLRIG